jgi:hypothetical protein
MSLYESKDSTGVVSLRKLFDGDQEIEGISNLSIEEIAYLFAVGWPAAVQQEKQAALQMATNYVEAVINMDVQRVDNIDKNQTGYVCYCVHLHEIFQQQQVMKRLEMI